jgi:endonuclease YncB( thermonuclease family)
VSPRRLPEMHPRLTPAGTWARAAVLVLLLAVGGAAAGDTIHGLAIVREDGSLLIKNRVVVLFGIYLPPTGRQCREWERPVRCDSRAVLALDFKVRGFVTCLPEGEDDEGRIHAICYLDRTRLSSGEDLGAYLIDRGWALALPYAPFEYHAMERIAQAQGRGVWGYSIDSITRPRRW